MSDTQTERARRLAEIAERESKATKGPWHVERRHASEDRCDGIKAHIGHTHPPEQNCWDVDDCPGQEAEDIVTTDSGFYGPCAYDAEFIAHARADIPYLLEEVKRLSAAVQAEREQCCKDVCADCRNTDDLAPAAFVDGKWRHKVRPGKGAGFFSCDAGPIHDRGSRSE